MKNLWTANIKPMLLKEISKPFNSKDYIYELKYDGIRCLIYASFKEFKIISRNQIDLTKLYPELKIIQSMVKGKTIFDGEIICTEEGLPSFSKLQQRTHLKDIDKINHQSIINPVTFMCFDIIYQDKNLTNFDLMKRKAILDKYEDNNYFVKVKFINEMGIGLFKEIKKLHLEGIVAKLKNSKYITNIRSDNWIKIKNFKEETFYIGGYFYKEKSPVFSVVLGEYINSKLSFVGKVFIAKKNKLFKELIKTKKIKSKFVNFDDKNINYVRPLYKCKIKYIERTPNNNLRQPFYVKSGGKYE